MRKPTSKLPLVAVSLTVLLCGAVAGSLFGERSITATEEHVLLRASAIVSTLQEWLPEQAEPTDLVYDGINSMLTVLDPHSNFLDPYTYHRMQVRQEGSFYGVGIIISRRQGKVTVIAPMEGTPASAKGIRAGDVIAAVGGESTEEMSLDEVVDRVRGPEGTVVQLSLQRPGLKELLQVDIRRAQIPTNSVRFAFMLDDEVGYIRLSEFSNTTVREVQEALSQLNEQGMTKLVFDLRNNPGGPLDASVGVSDMFLPKGQLIVSTRGRTSTNNATYLAPGKAEMFSGPLVILVNAGSASASEIVAGAVQDHDRGLVLGETTFGKGLVQTVFTVRDAGLVLTTARYYTASGRCIQRDYESYFDYVNHRDNGTKDTDASQATFKTDAGRLVQGGGGITPDITVEARPLSETVARLYGQSAFFRFAVLQLKDLSGDEQKAFAREFEVTDAVLSQFLEFVKQEEILDEEALAALDIDPQALDDVRRSIYVEILNATLGFEAGYRVLIDSDDQLQAAIEHMDQAEELWYSWKTKNGEPAG